MPRSSSRPAGRPHRSIPKRVVPLDERAAAQVLGLPVDLLKHRRNPDDLAAPPSQRSADGRVRYKLHDLLPLRVAAGAS